MKKMILGLVMATMLMCLVGCGGSEANNNTDKNNGTSTESYIDGVTGERVEVEISDDKTYTYYAEVTKALNYEDGSAMYQLTFRIEDGDYKNAGASAYKTEKPELSEGDVVKVVCSWNETDNKPNLQDIISVEKVEEE